MSQLDTLKTITTIVADTGEIEEIKKYHPTDATTNPSLILKAASMPEYFPLIDEAIHYGKRKGGQNPLELIMTKLFVNFGIEILKLIPGRISTEVDAAFSFDVGKSIEKAHEYIRLYEEAGIGRERILIKLASTWEGVLAARTLEKEGIHCNMTLMFCLAQAIACAEAKATLISPFVGRILDWYKKEEGVEGYAPAQDPGVQSVTQIFNYYKKFGHKTQIMGASFRNKEEILELAGCDLLTISPKLLEELSATESAVAPKLSEEKATQSAVEPLDVDEQTFRWYLNEDAMATEKLSEGIRNFAKDARKLKDQMTERLG